ncbi:unnamed protein product [Oreochromis niloticus]|nr:unnamed protein product [Mustela putorius furo]
MGRAETREQRAQRHGLFGEDTTRERREAALNHQSSEMKHTLVCFIFLTALQDGNTGLVKAQTLTHRAEEGGNITVKCSFTWSGSRKLFCKEKCENGNILVETSDDAAQNGRYSIKYEIKGFFSYTLYVSITQLKQSDSGRYRCSLDRIFDTGKDEFELIVTAASTTSTPNGTLRPFSASVFLSSASTPPTTQSLSSTSGSSTPSSASTPPTTQSLSSTSGSSTPSSASSGSSALADVLLYVRLVLVVVISIFLASLLMKRRAVKPRGPPVESEHADITQDNQLCEEIREEDRQSSSPPAGVSSVYATPKASNQMEMKTQTSAASPPLLTTK